MHLLAFSARLQEGRQAQEVAQFQAELEEARTQLQLLQKQLDEQLSKQPMGNQEVMFVVALHLSQQDRQGWALLLGTLSPFIPCLLAQRQLFCGTSNEIQIERFLCRQATVKFFCSCDFSLV